MSKNPHQVGLTIIISSVGKIFHQQIIQYVGLPLDFTDKYLVMTRYVYILTYSAVPNIRAVCNKRTGGYFFRPSLSEQTVISKQDWKKSQKCNQAWSFSISLLYKMHEIRKRAVWNK